MATDNLGKCISLKAGADFSAKQYRFAVVSAPNTAAVAGEGVPVVGVIQDNPISGATTAIAIDGVSKVKVGANPVVAGALAKSDANGLADTAASGDDGVGIFLTSGAAGETVEVALVKSGLRA